MDRNCDPSGSRFNLRLAVPFDLVAFRSRPDTPGPRRGSFDLGWMLEPGEIMAK